MSGAHRFSARLGLLFALVATTGIALALLATGGTDALAAKQRLKPGPAAVPLYDKAWRFGVSRKNKRWANRVARCESGRNPNALGAGGLYRGAFQFHRSTWRNAPRSPGGDPRRYSYRTQAFVAVRLKMRDGAGHWPNCP